MHELSLVNAIFKVVQEKVREFNVQRVVRINLTVGDLTNVEEATLNSMFGVCAEGTVLAGAKLAVERVPARGKCRECAAEFTIEKYRLQCPQCGRQRVELIAGKEFYINNLEVE